MRINAHGLAFVVTLALGVLGLVFIPSCGSTDASTFGSGDGGDGEGGDGDNVPGFNTDGGVTSNYKCPGCPDFPPIGAPMCAPAVLGPAVLSYPTDGLLLPPNMNVLEVQFVPPPGATLFEVDFENADTNVKVETKCAQVPDVRAGASRGCGITLPQGAWNDIANANRDKDPLHVTVRATVDETCVTTSTAKIDINFSRDDLSGGIYYWQSATFGGVGGKTGGIYLHDFGTLDPTPTPFFVAGTQDGGTGTCVGCHTLSRDGLRMAVMTDDPDGDDALGDSKMHTMDVPSVSIIGGRNVSPGFQAFTHDHAKMIAATFKDHMNTSFDVFDGDGTTLLGNAALPVSMKATQPDLSRDDQTLLYVVPAAGSISNTGDMHFFGGSLYTSAFDNANNTLSAPAAVLVSAGDRNFYYPSFTPDKTFIILNDAPQPGNTATTNNDSFYNRNASENPALPRGRKPDAHRSPEPQRR